MAKETRDRKRSKQRGVSGLSTLEADIMNIVWGAKEIIVREVYESMIEDQGYLPYTTVMAAMNRMAGEGFLKQKKGSKAWVYSAAVSRDDMAKSILDDIVNNILAGDPATLVSYLQKLKKY